MRRCANQFNSILSDLFNAYNSRQCIPHVSDGWWAAIWVAGISRSNVIPFFFLFLLFWFALLWFFFIVYWQCKFETIWPRTIFAQFRKCMEIEWEFHFLTKRIEYLCWVNICEIFKAQQISNGISVWCTYVHSFIKFSLLFM